MARLGSTLGALALASLLAGCATPQFPLIEPTIEGMHGAMRVGSLSCRSAVQGYLDRIAAYDRNSQARANMPS